MPTVLELDRIEEEEKKRLEKGREGRWDEKWREVSHTSMAIVNGNEFTRNHFENKVHSFITWCGSFQPLVEQLLLNIVSATKFWQPAISQVLSQEKNKTDI